jgi:guanylate kinase
MAQIVCLGGQPGVGKDEVAHRLLQRIPELVRVPRITTRPPRPGERAGEHYQFVDRSEFQALSRAGRIIGYDDYCGHLYGIDREAFANVWLERKVVLGVFGISSIAVKAAYPSALTIYLIAPIETLEARMRHRGDAETSIAERLAVIEAKLREEPQQFCERIPNEGDIERTVDQTIRTIHCHGLIKHAP